MKKVPSSQYVPQSKMYFSSDECLTENPEDPAIAVVSVSFLEKLSKEYELMLDFIRDCGHGKYVPIHSDRIARNMVKKFELDSDK